MADDDLPSDVLYHPVKTLGRGAFGEAVLYRRVEDDSLVVWKEIDLSRASEKELRRAKQEVSVLSLMNHPNIITFYNDYVDGRTLLIEMEYANGGTLQELIKCRVEMFSEEIIWWYFFQVASAVKHIHEHGIVHRDIKSANVFLTKSGLCKLGDFGLSLIMEDTRQMAASNVGTYFYMAPEVHLGRLYNQKADIWSIGCVLFELCELDIPFRTSNPAGLALEIVESDIPLIHQQYTGDLQNLIKSLLTRNPDQRPTIDDVLETPIVKATRADMEIKISQLDDASRKNSRSMSERSSRSSVPVVATLTSEVYCWGGGKQTPMRLDEFSHGKAALKVSAGYSHFAVVTVEKELYTWTSWQGGGVMYGQLGHGDKASYRSPKLVTTLDGIPVRHAVCGEDFTICLTEDGEVYACGSDYWGCLGQGQPVEQEQSYTVPVPVSLPDHLQVEQIACGDAHVVALTRSKEVLSWGCGEFGRLGLGSEMNVSSPQKVNVPGRSPVIAVCCTRRGSLLLTTNGRVLACGDNECNQLGLNVPLTIRSSKTKGAQLVSYKTLPSQVKSLSRYHISSLACGSRHSAVISDTGRLITFGSNKHGQLGTGDLKKYHSPHIVEGELLGKTVLKVACGDGFTVAATSDNVLYSWGIGDKGQLGTSLPDGRKTVLLPRPVFGSLYSIPELSCRHWHTIMIAERVTSSRTISSSSDNTVQSEPSLNGENVVFVSVNDSKSHSQIQANNSADSTSLPSWLRREWEDAVARQSIDKRQHGTMPLLEDTAAWTEKHLVTRPHAPSRSLDAGRPTIPQQQSSGTVCKSSSMDRLHAIQRATASASATLTITNSGSVIVKSQDALAGNTRAMSESSGKLNGDCKLKVKSDDVGMLAGETDAHGLVPSCLDMALYNDTTGQTEKRGEEVQKRGEEVQKRLKRKHKAPVRTFSMSVADHKFVMDEIQSLAEQIQLDLERPESESGETLSESSNEGSRVRQDSLSDYDQLLLRELRKLKAQNDKMKDTIEKQRRQIDKLTDENKMRRQKEDDMWRLLANWTFDCRVALAVDSPKRSVVASTWDV